MVSTQATNGQGMGDLFAIPDVFVVAAWGDGLQRLGGEQGVAVAAGGADRFVVEAGFALLLKLLAQLLQVVVLRRVKMFITLPV